MRNSIIQTKNSCKLRYLAYDGKTNRIKKMIKSKIGNLEVAEKLQRKKYKNLIDTLAHMVLCELEKTSKPKRDAFFRFLGEPLVIYMLQIYNFLNKGEKMMAKKNSTNDVFAKAAVLSTKYSSVEKTEFIKTGSVVFDSLLGGGIPKGNFLLLSGPTGFGKTTLALYTSLSFCKQGKRVLYLDYEATINQNMVESMQLGKYLYHKDNNPNGIFFSFKVHSFADAEKFLDSYLDSIDLVIIDSITSMMPEKMTGKSVEDLLPGIQARIMSNLLLKYKAVFAKKGIACLMLNQVRTKLRFNGQTVNEGAGGNAVHHYADYIITMKPCQYGNLQKMVKTIYGEEVVKTGITNDIYCNKSRYGRPNLHYNIHIVLGRGISNLYAYKDFLIGYGLIKKNVSWYEISLSEDVVKIQGDEELMKWMSENETLVETTIDKLGGFSLFKKSY